VLWVILNIMYGLQMEVSLSIAKSDSEHYLWLRNGGAILDIRK
jgi:hypothetical protein